MNDKRILPVVIILIIVAGICVIYAQGIRLKRSSVIETKIVLPSPPAQGGMPLRDVLNKAVSVRKYSAEPLILSSIRSEWMMVFYRISRD